MPISPLLDCQAIAACCVNHILPFDIVDDSVFALAYNCKIKSRTRFGDWVTELAMGWRIKNKTGHEQNCYGSVGWIQSMIKVICGLFWGEQG